MIKSRAGAITKEVIISALTVITVYINIERIHGKTWINQAIHIQLSDAVGFKNRIATKYHKKY